MEQVVGAIQRVTDIMAEIASASQEQIQGIEQVNQAIGLMDESTQQNAALVEESAAAAGALQDQAQRLAGLVNVFKLDARMAAPVATSSRALAVAATPAVRKEPRMNKAKPVQRAEAQEWESF
jgi:methyl-accepting chemotaxis protein